MADEQPQVNANAPGEGEDITPDKDGGVLKLIKRQGNGDSTPQSGDEVVVHYVGTLLDGTKFDSSRDRDSFFKFELGKGRVIKAWDLGVATMKKGEICQLTCRADYAYGESGSPPTIPPNATLVFEVELFNWNIIELSNDGGASMAMIKRCDSEFDTPEEGMEVEVHIKGSNESNVFEDKDVRFFIGDGNSAGILPIIETAILKLKQGEIAAVSVSPAYGFGEKGNTELSIPPNASLEYEIELKWLEEQLTPWNMDQDKKLECARSRKSRGTEFFKAMKMKLALKSYADIASILADTDDFSDEQKSSASELKLAGRLNEAACNLKIDDFDAACSACDKALELDNNNIKAMYRKAQAQIGMKDYLIAYKGLQELLKLEPENKAAKQLSARALHLHNAERAMEKKRYNKMFQKFAEEDTRKQPQDQPTPAENVTDDGNTEANDS
ncbi:uncharacterized protein TRIADDRAFT_51478 [Trichoplax adhaerens]|uniref:peptidylprolyl isomerase n=1 Tax=Trichoplax adhaerens TaxID=10228 RepID=B3RJB5_TRIAD|nr:hypothetical protein TRIADDRAFT_51478 [Trichoplax adhaerens]EDV29300.1 hypothetical protein TRIADDRAFT_51478 [Trichoplax adhaerens]|eukprot:XP_002108502.1 hypothetical protein TRIADDRAFT_51478 [Trichoplax adhaerens]